PAMCMTTTPALRSATARTMAGSRTPETSFTREAPASMALAATVAFIVSIERGTSTLAARSRMTVPMRRHSSSAETASDPGLVDSLEYEVKEKALKAAPDLPASKRRARVDEALAAFISAEKRDEAKPDGAAKAAAESIEDVAGQVHTKRIVLYPYAHLSSSLA